MSTIDITKSDLANLRIGDKVQLKRNLDHPAWMNQVESEFDGTRWVRDDSVEEVIGVCAIIDRRDIPAVPGWGGHEAKTLLRLPSGFWYDGATGRQEHSESTLIGVV